MIIELTKNEKIILLGLLEDIAQAEDVNKVFPIDQRFAIVSIIQKLGGSFFGKLITKDQLFSMYGIQEGSDNGETI